MAMTRRMVLKYLLGVGGACLLPMDLRKKALQIGTWRENKRAYRQKVRRDNRRRIPFKPLDQASVRQPGKWGG